MCYLLSCYGFSSVGFSLVEILGQLTLKVI